MALIYLTAMAAVFSSAYCKPTEVDPTKPTVAVSNEEAKTFLEDFARSDTYAVCTINYISTYKEDYGKAKFGYNPYNNGYNPYNEGYNTYYNPGYNQYYNPYYNGNNGYYVNYFNGYKPDQVGNAQVGENVYGTLYTKEQNNDNDDFIQCAQHAYQVYIDGKYPSVYGYKPRN